LPLRQGVNLGGPSILAGDVKLRSVTLVGQALELRRQFEPPFLIHTSWVIAAKHKNPLQNVVSATALTCFGVAGVEFIELDLLVSPYCSTFSSIAPLSTTSLHIVSQTEASVKSEIQQNTGFYQVWCGKLNGW
jgi:hypothetical protein